MKGAFGAQPNRGCGVSIHASPDARGIVLCLDANGVTHTSLG
jgi:hypothetical protein